MGTGSSFLRTQDEDDVLGIGFGSSQGVIKRIPIEVKPRGRLGLRSVKSLGKPKGGSLRSALSIDLENPEVEKIRKDFDMYRLNKENDLANMLKKVQKLETENKRLRVELQTLQKTCKKLRDERDSAIEAEHQALVRSAAFENDRDKIQRQFKIFRETKESELQNLLKARRDLENKIFKIGGHGILEDSELAEVGLKPEGSVGGGNLGDWWPTLESEPSLGSTTQLHSLHTYKGPEFGHTLMEMEGPYLNVTKDDWTIAATSLAHIYPSIPDSLQTNTIRIFISAPDDVKEEKETFINKYGPCLSKMCSSEGRFCLLIHMPCQEGNQNIAQEHYIQARCRQIDQATVFLAFLKESMEPYTTRDYDLAHLKNPGSKQAVFCFRELVKECTSQDTIDLRKRVKETAGAKVIDDYDSSESGAHQAFTEIENILKFELGLDQKAENVEIESILEPDGPSALCGGCLWDTNLDHEQMEALSFAGRSSCELGFEKYYERLSAHVSTPGPLPPLRVSGLLGSGRSLLLAKWIGLQQHKTSGNVVLYHFVGSPTSSSADPLIMIRRLTHQLMQQISSPPSLACDPVRLVDEFPKWLEKVSSKLPGGLVLVLDSIDKLHNAENQLKWLLDPLPVDCRIIISVHDDTCPPSWKFWPVLQLDKLSNKNIEELLLAELASFGKSITSEHKNQILTHCRSTSSSQPMYVVTLASDIARCSTEEQVTASLSELLVSSDTVSLFKLLMEHIMANYECADTSGMLKTVLCLVLASRNGVSESELMVLLPSLTWNFWAPMCNYLMDRHILSYRSGLLVFAHQQAEEAAKLLCLDNDGNVLREYQRMLIDMFSKLTRPGDVTYRVADELPWLNRQVEDKEQLQNNILDLCIFVKLYGRGRCGELLSYWKYVGMERNVMAQKYYEACKEMENMVGQFDGMVTLPRIADVYEALGRYLRDLGLLNEALTPLQRALEIRETALDPDHPSVAQSLHQVAGLHAQQAKFGTAELLYKQAMDIFVGAFGRDHVLVAKELEALAVLYQKQGKHQLADPLHKRALSIKKNSQVSNVPAGRIQGLDHLRQRALQLEGLATSADSPDLARTLNEIGVLYYLQNNIETAECFFKRSLEMREAILGHEHPDVAQSLNNLAALYNDKKLYVKAEPLYERALQIRKKIFADDHPSVMAVEKHLAMLYKKINKEGKAEPLYKHAVDVRESCFGKGHPSVATALVNLAVLHSQQGNHHIAEPLYDRALKIYSDSFGPTHPRVAETLRNMALLKYDQGEFKTAANLYKRATEMKDTEQVGYQNHKISSSGSDTTHTLRNSHTAQAEYT